MDLISLRCVSVKWSTKFSHQSRQQPRVQKVWSQERHVRRNGMSDANHQPARLIFRCACHEEAAALNKLDWDELLGSVAQFARTEAGLNAVRSMAIPTTREETLERMAATQAVERYSCQLNLTVDLSGAETRLAHEALQALNSEAVASGQQLVGMITCMLCAQKVEKDMAAAHRMRPTLLEEWSIRPLVAKFSKVPAADEFMLEAGRVLDVEGDVKATATEETAHWTAVVEDWEGAPRLVSKATLLASIAVELAILVSYFTLLKIVKFPAIKLACFASLVLNFRGPLLSSTNLDRKYSWKWCHMTHGSNMDKRRMCALYTIFVGLIAAAVDAYWLL